MIKLRFLDWAALGINILVVGFFSFHAYARSDGTPMLYIQSEASSWVYPLDRDGDYRIAGPLGETHIVLRGREAHVESSPCRDKICIYLGKIARKGDWIACLPNRIFLRVDAEEEGEVDAAVF